MDTAQPLAAETDPNKALDAAASAFLKFDDPMAARKRDAHGRFAPETEQQDEGEAEEDDLEPDAGEGEYDEADADEDTDEAADDAEEEESAQPMPPSWPESEAEHWSQLPAETQAFLAKRETEREQAINAKFQESANARKDAESAREAANATRDRYEQELSSLLSVINPVEPDPRAFGYGTGQFNEAAYNVAVQQYRQEVSASAQLKEQHEALKEERAEEENRAFNQWKDAIETQFLPKLLDEEPGLKDPTKSPAIVQSLVQYAVSNGIPEELFAPERQNEITSAQIRLLLKAKRFDELDASVKSGTIKPKPKPAPTVVRPGVSSPRSSQKKTRLNRARDRLAREGSVEAAAEVFKQFMG